MKKALWLTLLLCLAAFPALASPLDAPYSYDLVSADMEALAAAYPTAPFSYEAIGQSVEGRALYAISLGSGDRYALCLAGLHGNEIANTPMVMAALGDLLARWQSGDERVKDVLQSVTLTLVPCGNPDGYEKAVGYAEKGRRYSVKVNANKVNLNRNFPTPYWGGKEKKGDKDYAGPSAASEPETQAMVALANAHAYGAMMDLHSRGRQIYFGKGGYSQEDLPAGVNIEALAAKTEALANALLPADKYRLREQAPASRNGGFGSSTDYLYALGTPAVTVETMPTNYDTATVPKLIQAEYALIDLPEMLLRLCQAALSE